MITFDFRGDVDRMDVLKTLPIAPSRLVLGQLFAPVLLVTLVQLILVVIVQLAWGGAAELLAVVVAFAVPVNFLLFGLENLLFLWFPTRMLPATPGDVQMMGRYMLLFLLKVLALSVAGGLVAAVAAAVYFASGQRTLPAFAAAWVLVCALAAALVPLVAHAFQRFDVARDTPP